MEMEMAMAAAAAAVVIAAGECPPTAVDYQRRRMMRGWEEESGKQQANTNGQRLAISVDGDGHESK